MTQQQLQTVTGTLAEKFGFTEKQLDLVRRTVAKGATDDELELFFYRCKELQLNPLMPGQIYFLKFGNNPGTVIVGLDGFRARAQRTGKLAGIKRGVIRNEKGQCIGAWADVYRKDWEHPAHEEVALHEYNTGRQNWAKMPETMIKKVAEVAALRMAFPDELGGVYTAEEMEQADRSIKDVSSQVQSHPLPSAQKSNGKSVNALSPERLEEKKQLEAKMSELIIQTQTPGSEIEDFLNLNYGVKSVSNMSQLRATVSWLEEKIQGETVEPEFDAEHVIN